MVFNEVRECRYGTFLYNKLYTYVGKSIELYGEFSQGEAHLFDQLLKPGSIVLEAGANYGTHTVHLAQIVGEQGHVFAFEPQPHVFYGLCANVALNNLINVTCRQEALGTEEGEIIVPVVDPRNKGKLWKSCSW